MCQAETRRHDFKAGDVVTVTKDVAPFVAGMEYLVSRLSRDKYFLYFKGRPLGGWHYSRFVKVEKETENPRKFRVFGVAGGDTFTFGNIEDAKSYILNLGRPGKTYDVAEIIAMVKVNKVLEEA